MRLWKRVISNLERCDPEVHESQNGKALVSSHLKRIYGQRSSSRCCSIPECQRERRRRSQRLRRAAKSSPAKPNGEILTGENNYSRLQAASKQFEAPMISEDPLIVGLIAMLCDTDNPDQLRTAMRLRERGHTDLHGGWGHEVVPNLGQVAVIV